MENKYIELKEKTQDTGQTRDSKMITHKEKPDKDEDINNILNPIVKKWFKQKFRTFCLPQKFAVLDIHSRINTLVSAPTGSGKTLTAMLAILNELVDSAKKGKLQDKIYAVYINPLKALSNDLEVNLKRPLKEIEELAGKELGIRIGVRTGDTTAKQKAEMLRKPPHILVCTPENLAIVLSSIKFRNHLKEVEWCIVDEIHALAENKRGTYLSLSLERLQHLSKGMCRIGLSATISPLKEVAEFLVGPTRNCKIVDVQFLKNMDLKVISPVDNLIETSHGEIHSKLYKLIDELVQENKTTLIFTNTRAATERVVDYLKTKFPKKYIGNIGAHHGSLSKSSRHNIEEKLRKGELKCVVSSTSLELGIDIGYIDLVLCLGSPKSVARFLQRAGRSGHKLHQTVKAKVIVLDRDDLIECSVLVKSAIEKKIDKIHIPKNALDVLAQQIAGMAIEQVWEEKEMYKVIKQSHCYKDLSLKDFNDILRYLAGEFVDLEERHVYARIWRNEGKIGKRGKLARVIYMTNIGTIPDQSYITVKIGDQIVGMLDEMFVERMKPGDVFVLGGETYMFKYTRGMTAQVSASANRPPTVPSWVSEMLPLSFDLANEIGRFRRLMLEKFTFRKNKNEIIQFIHKHLYVDDRAANAIYEYFKEQYDYIKAIPTDKTILIEHTQDENGPKTVIHSLFGRRVNDCLSRAVAFAISRTQHKDVEVGINDNGFYIAGISTDKVLKAMKMLKAEKLNLVMNAAIEKSEMFKRRFRHCAGRALMILRNYLGHKKTAGRQQISAQILINAVKKIDPDFTILREAKRESLEDAMDIENTKKILQKIQDKEIMTKEIKTTIPSPFALKIALQGHIDVLRIEDKYAFLQRMHQQILAKIAGEDVEQIRIKDFLEKAQKDRSEFKEQLKREAWNLKVPRFVKIELIRIINGERREINPEFVAGIEKYRRDIERDWPEELKKFLFNVLDDIKTSEFSYEKLWRDEDIQKEHDKEEEKLQIIEEFNDGARRTRLDPQIRYDVYNLVDGEKEVRKETLVWMKDLLKGAVPKAWKDNVVKFLQGKVKELK